MDSPRPIETHVLRFFIAYYRFIGAQVYEIKWRNWKSVLCLVWNVCFVLFISIGILTFKPFRLQSMTMKCAENKPLFEYFVHLSTKYTYSIVYFLQSIHFLVYGRRILNLLDSDCFRRVYHSKGRARIIFGVYFTCNHVFFVAVMYDRVKSYSLQWPTLSDLYAYLCLYVIFNFVYWLYIILHYSQYATYEILKQIEKKYKLKEEKSSTHSDDDALAEIKQLARINYQLNRLLSAPLITYLLLTVLNIIMVISLSIICRPNSRLFAHIAISCLFANYLALLNKRILQKVKQLLDSLKSHYDKNCKQVQPQRANKLIANLSDQLVLLSIAQQNQIQSYELKLQSRKIRYNEIDHYCEYFRIQVFQLGTIDIRFLFKTAIFILGYVVFFTQTH